MFDLIERLVWGKKSKSRKLVIGAHEWHHLKDDIYGNLPAKQAAVALKIIHQYEEKYMRVK